MTASGQRHSTSPPPSRVTGFIWTLIVLLLGVFLGVLWHAPIRSVLGLKSSSDAHSATPAAPGQLWTCSMHPQVLQDKPGMCPLCHMELTPVKTGGAPDASAATGHQGASVTIDPVVVQNMGVRLAPVREGQASRSIRLVGYVELALPNVRDITMRTNGWIRRLYAATPGMKIEKGDKLFDLYSPDLQLAIEEFIAAHRASDSNSLSPTSPSASEALRAAAVKKLERLGLDSAQIEALAKLNKAPEAVAITSPATGTLVEKLVAEGAAVKPDDRVLRIVDLSSVWLDAQVFEKDLPFVHVGQHAEATISSRPGEAIHGEIIFVEPLLDSMTRSARVRLALENKNLSLFPGMYATVNVSATIAQSAMLIPREAIIDTGDQQMVFVSLGEGVFEPREIRRGAACDDGQVQILDGLKIGEQVVSSGQFLIDSESRLREAIQKFLSGKSGGGSAIAPPPSPHQMEIDAVFAAYLALAEKYGEEQEALPAQDPQSFLAAVDALKAKVKDPARAKDLSALGEAAARLKGLPTKEQREAFKTLSDRMIALADAWPPSDGVAKEIYVMHCPMAPGSWLQRNPDLANPYYDTDMKSCGTTQRRIGTTEGGAK